MKQKSKAERIQDLWQKMESAQKVFRKVEWGGPAQLAAEDRVDRLENRLSRLIGDTFAYQVDEDHVVVNNTYGAIVVYKVKDTRPKGGTP